MNNKYNTELSFSEMELLEELNQRYELLSSISGTFPLLNIETGNPVIETGCNNSLVKHRLEIYFGLNKAGLRRA